MRLLLIEDEEKVARFIVKGLTAERFAVDVVSEGDRGLENAILKKSEAATRVSRRRLGALCS